MSNVIRVDTQKLMDYAQKFQRLARRLYQVQQAVSPLYNQTHIVGLSTIANRRTVSQCGDVMLNCSNWCLDTLQDFQKVESYLKQQEPENFVRPKNLVLDEYSANSISNMTGKGIKDTGKVVSGIGKSASNDNLKGAGKILGFVGQAEIVLSGEGTSDERLEDYISLLSKGESVISWGVEQDMKKMQGWNEDIKKIDPNSEAGKFIAKYGSNLYWLGLAGTVAGTGTTLWKSSCGKDVSDFLLDFHDLADSGESWATALQKLYPDDIIGNAKDMKGQLAAIGAIFSMGTAAVGDVMKASEDGNYTIDEYGNTCLRTGITGASSLVNAYTYGLIDIDPDKAMTTFQDNIAMGQDWIYSVTDNTAAQVVLSIPTTVVVSVASAAEVAADAVIDTGAKLVNFGISIGDAIMSWFS